MWILLGIALRCHQTWRWKILAPNGGLELGDQLRLWGKSIATFDYQRAAYPTRLITQNCRRIPQSRRAKHRLQRKTRQENHDFKRK